VKPSVESLATEHRLDPDGLREALEWATLAYDGERTSDSNDDTLDRLIAPIAAIVDLLNVEVNRLRLATQTCPDEPDWIDDTLCRLETLRAVAQSAHRPRGRGRPARKADLRAAYGVLAGYWRRQRGDRGFTQEWSSPADGLKPLSPAARFLADALGLIAPGRRRLPAELRDLMAGTVRALPGRRRGRLRDPDRPT
jgi:hypothetical protein